MANTVKITATTKDNASGPLDNIRDKFDKIKSQSAKGFGLGVGLAAFNAIGGAADKAAEQVIGFLTDSIAKAKEEEAGIARLDAALKANIKSYDGNRDAIEGVIKEREKLAFSDGEQRDALALLVTRTHDVNKALGLERQAMDLARLKSISLADASGIIGKVFGGNVAILKRYGIQVKAGATATEALAEIQKATAGQAEAFANTTEGAAQSLQIAIDDLQEDLGKHLLPVLKDLANVVRGDVIPAIDDIVVGFDTLMQTIDDNKAVIDPLVTTLQLLTGTYAHLHEEQSGQADAEARAHGIIDATTKKIEDQSAAMQPYIDKLKKTDKATDGVADASAAARTRIQNVGKAAGITGAKFDDMRDAIRDAARLLNEQKRGHEETTLKIKGTELALKDDRRELKKLEEIKHPTLDQQRDMNDLRLAILEGRDELTNLKADLKAAGKVNMGVTKSWIDRLTIDESEAGRKAQDWYYWLNKVSHVGGGGGGAATGGGGARNPKQSNIPRAGGGPVTAGNTYRVGENGPETLVMGAGGGMVIPNSGGGSGMVFNFTFNGGADPGQAHAHALFLADSITSTLRQQRARAL